MNKARYSNYLDRDFVSVDIKSGISRLRNIYKIRYPFVASTQIYQYRNRLIHYALNGIFEQIINDVAEAMNQVAEFVENEIMQDLPEAAQKDFQNSIANYRDYAKVLSELKM